MHWEIKMTMSTSLYAIKCVSMELSLTCKLWDNRPVKTVGCPKGWIRGDVIFSEIIFSKH